MSDDEMRIADLALPIVKVRPGINTMALAGNLAIAHQKMKFPTEVVYRACASDPRFTTDRDPESGLTRYYPKELP